MRPPQPPIRPEASLLWSAARAAPPPELDAVTCRAEEVTGDTCHVVCLTLSGVKRGSCVVYSSRRAKSLAAMLAASSAPVASTKTRSGCGDDCVCGAHGTKSKNVRCAVCGDARRAAVHCVECRDVSP